MPEFVEGRNRITADIVDRSNIRVGFGDLMTCLSLEFDTILSNAGSFTARFPANDPRLQDLQLKRHYLDFYIDGELVFYGLTESTSHEIANDGQRILVVSGRDSLAELDETTLGFDEYLELGAPGVNYPFQIVDAYNGTNGYLTTDVQAWTAMKEISAEPDYPLTDTAVYGKFAGESALTGLKRVAEYIGESFRLALDEPVRQVAFEEPNPRRHVVWLGPRTPDSGVVAIQGAGDPTAAETNTNICFIQSLTERRNASRMVTKIYPYGSGLGETRLDLAGTSRVAPAGFTYNASENSISSDAALVYMGKALARHVNFKDVRPLFNTDADIQYAKDFLFDVAVAYLSRNDDVNDVIEYEASVVQLPSSVRVGMTIHIVYVDDTYELDDDFVLLGIRTTVQNSGERSYQLTISNTNQWRLTDKTPIVAQMEEGEIFAAHPQIDASAYWMAFREEVGDDTTEHVAEFPFWLSAEILTIRQVLFRFAVDRLLSAVGIVTYGDPNTGSGGATTTGATAAGTTDSGGSGTSGATAAGTTDSGGSGTSGATAAGTTNTDGTGTTSGTAVTVTTTGATDIGTTITTTTDTVPDPAYSDTNFGGLAEATQDPGLTWGTPATHYHQIGPHVHDITNHQHSYSHDHFAVTEHGHSSASHTHSTPNHSHLLAATHTHSTPAHTHVISATHTHSTPAHTHVISATHTHSMATHVHAAPTLVTTYALRRTPALNSYVIGDLEYSVNGGAWADLDDAIPVAGGYLEIDITPVIQNPAGLKRPNQEYNLVQVRRKSGAGTGKTAMIRAQVGIRATIQSVVSYPS